MRSGMLLVLTWILILCLSEVSVLSQCYSHTLPYHPKPLKVTNLHFFFHETLGVKHATTVLVAQPKITSGGKDNKNNPFRNGSLYALDVLLKTGPEDNSQVIGNVQGLNVIIGDSAKSAVSYFDFGFTAGEFNGSSISVFSRNPIADTERELAVVGGRGKFRMAKGFTMLKTLFINTTNLIVEYNMTVIHQ